MVTRSGTALRVSNGTQQGLVGSEEEQAILNFEDDIEEDTNEIAMFSDSEGLGINIKQSAIDRWAQPWRFSVVVKLFNRFIGYRILKDRLKKVWNLANPFEMLDLENNYFLIRFSTEEEWSHVLLGGPWMILGSYLVMQPWSPTFDVEDTQPASLTVWVRVPGLPIHFYKRRFLEAIGNALGQIVRIDYNTMRVSRAKFARLAIKLDLKKPLKDRIKVNKREYKILYEGFNEICFQCGRVGHVKEQCKSKFDEQGIETIIEGGANSNNGYKIANSTLPVVTETRFGDWMQVRQNRRKPMYQSAGQETTSKQTGNRETRKDVSRITQGMGFDLNRSKNKSGTTKHSTGSRFSALYQDEVEEIFGTSKEAETTDKRNKTVDFQFGMGAATTKEAVRAQNKKNAGNSNKNNNGALVTVGPLFHPGSTSNGQIPHDKEHRSKLRKLSRGQEAIEGSAETEVVSNTGSGSVLVCATTQVGQQGGAVKGTGKRSISPTSQIEITMSGGVKEKPPDKEIHCNRDQMDMHVEVGTLVAVEEQLKEGQLIVDISGISNS